MEKIYFVMPAYNEGENIEQTIRAWYPVVDKICKIPGYEAKMVIANDGSRDNTYTVMNKLKETGLFPYFKPLDKQNGGHGQTVLYLYRYAIDEGATYIFQTDSDGQTDPEEFWEFFNRKNDYDFQIGFRKGRQDGIGRIVVTKTLRLVVWLMFHVWVTDANTPYRLMRTDKLKPIMEIIPRDYFLCNVAISAIATKWKYKMSFRKITFKPRQGGINSINMKRIFKIGWKALSDFRLINKKLQK